MVETATLEPIKLGIYSYACPYCEYSESGSNSNRNMKSHIRRSHTKEKPYFCTICNPVKTFTRKDTLDRHSKIIHNIDPKMKFM